MYCVYCGSGAEQGASAVCTNCRMPPAVQTNEDIEPAYRALAHHKRFFPTLLTDVAYKAEEGEAAMVYCFVERYRGKHIHTFHLYREADNSFVLACTMLASQSGALYFHTKQTLFNKPEAVLAQVPINPLHPDFIAVLMPNSVLGTQFLLTTRPTNKTTASTLVAAALTPSKPRSTPGLGEEGSLLQDNEQNTATSSLSPSVEELAMIVFATNLSASTPNQIKAYVRTNPRCRTKVPIRQRMRQVSLTRAPSDLPALIFDRIASSLTPRSSSNVNKSSVGRANLTFYNALSADNDYDDEQEEQDDNQKDEISIYQNRKATWNEKVNGWTLDFNGRVQLSSKKNFILVPATCSNADNAGNAAIGIRFGKASKHRFNLDYKYPFSPLSAFATAMSMFTSKLAVAW